jgi:hypothetical protein
LMLSSEPFIFQFPATSGWRIVTSIQSEPRSLAICRPKINLHTGVPA